MQINITTTNLTHADWAKEYIMSDGFTPALETTLGTYPGCEGFNKLSAGGVEMELDVVAPPPPGIAAPTSPPPAAPLPWIFDRGSYSETHVGEVLVSIGGEYQTSGHIGMFIGDSVRGVVAVNSATIPMGTYKGLNYFSIVIYGNGNDNGKTVSFKFLTSDRAIIDLAETITWQVNGFEGNINTPTVLTGDFSPPPAPPVQPPANALLKVNLNKGWTWMSINVETADMTINAVFGPISAGNDYIKDQTKFTQYYDGFGYYGTLIDVSPKAMYKVFRATDGAGRTPANYRARLKIEGKPLTFPYDVTLTTGWNYLGCPYLVENDVTGAVAAGLPQKPNGKNMYEGNDMIKSQTIFATYYEGWGWFGNLVKIEAGFGYKMKLHGRAGPAQFLAPTGGRRELKPAQEVSRPEPATVPAGWAVDVSSFPETMTVTALVTLGGATVKSGTLAAFAGGDVRGVQNVVSSPHFGPHAGKSLFEVTVYGNGGETISFAYNDGSTTTLLDKELPFAIDRAEGNAIAPYRLAESMTQPTAKHSSKKLMSKLKRLLL